MFLQFFGLSWNRMSSLQKKAESDAIQLLTYAQELLRTDAHNVGEALKIRFKVTQEILPKRKLIIKKEHPRSLLLDVDRRIEQAYIRLLKEFREADQPEEVLKKKGFPTLEEILRIKTEVYERIKENERKKYNQTLCQVFVLTVLSLLFIALIRQISGPNEIYNAFNWLPPR